MYEGNWGQELSCIHIYTPPAPSTYSLSSAWWTEEQHALWGVDAKVDETFGMEQWGLNHFTKLFDLIFAPAHITVGHVGLLLDLGSG